MVIKEFEHLLNKASQGNYFRKFFDFENVHEIYFYFKQAS